MTKSLSLQNWERMLRYRSLWRFKMGVFSMNNVTRLDNIISFSLTSFAYPSYLDMVEQHIWLGRYGVVEYVVQRGMVGRWRRTRVVPKVRSGVSRVQTFDINIIWAKIHGQSLLYIGGLVLLFLLLRYSWCSLLVLGEMQNSGQNFIMSSLCGYQGKIFGELIDVGGTEDLQFTLHINTQLSKDLPKTWFMRRWQILCTTEVTSSITESGARGATEEGRI